MFYGPPTRLILLEGFGGNSKCLSSAARAFQEGVLYVARIP